MPMQPGFAIARSMDKRVIANEVLLEEAAALMTEGREVSFTPLGSSMLPFIRGGRDSVTLRKVSTVKVGDIALIRLTGPRYVLHRVIAVTPETVTLMGDGNLSGTESCPPEEVLGIVTAIQRGKRVIQPGDGKWWRRIPRFFKRYFLAIYRRII